MKFADTPHRRFLCGLLTGLLLMALSLTPVQAEQVLRHLRDPLTVELQTPLNSRTAKVGERFSAILREPYSHQGKILPAGMVFNGQVVKVRPESKRFARPAYMALEVQEAVFPDGTVYQLDNTANLESPDKKLYDPTTRPPGNLLTYNIPVWVASLGTSIPLRTATDLKGGEVFAISLGARVATAIALELANPRNPDRPLPYKVGTGVLRGTGLETTYQVLRKAPDVQLASGEDIEVYLDRDAMRLLFDAVQPTATAIPTP